MCNMKDSEESKVLDGHRLAMARFRLIIIMEDGSIGGFCIRFEILRIHRTAGLRLG